MHVWRRESLSGDELFIVTMSYNDWSRVADRASAAFGNLLRDCILDIAPSANAANNEPVAITLFERQLRWVKHAYEKTFRD